EVTVVGKVNHEDTTDTKWFPAGLFRCAVPCRVQWEEGAAEPRAAERAGAADRQADRADGSGAGDGRHVPGGGQPGAAGAGGAHPERRRASAAERSVDRPGDADAG